MKSNKSASAAGSAPLGRSSPSDEHAGETQESPDDPAPAPTSPPEVASYVEEMSAGLAALARASGLTMLAYLLDVAQAEAASQVQAQKMRARETLFPVRREP